jgi:hypothetical protein
MRIGLLELEAERKRARMLRLACSVCRSTFRGTADDLGVACDDDECKGVFVHEAELPFTVDMVDPADNHYPRGMYA